MMQLENPASFASLGMPDQTIDLLATHLAAAEEHVFRTDANPEQALKWLRGSLFEHLDPEQAEMMYAVGERNYLAKPVQYNEHGYDSCQSHRELSKVVSEAILLGGLVYEGSLVGLNLSMADAKAMIQSELVIHPKEEAGLVALSKEHGKEQDFIFPGVTPSSDDVPSLEDMAYRTLSGRPYTSVRTMTGVGGLRSDQDWNHVTDLPTFAELKITEDKRYYPGLGIFYLLMTRGAANLPNVQAMKQGNPTAYAAMQSLERTLKSAEKIDYQGVSVLCASFLPKWGELKAVQGFATDQTKDLSANFHSPSYEFASLLALFEGRLPQDHIASSLGDLEQALQKSWGFNSTIHLPWASKEAYLSGGLMGKITNQVGDYATRYGVGYNGKSLEIVEYHYGAERRFPFGVAGLGAMVMKIYPNGECFEGEHQEVVLGKNNPLWARIGQVGFLRAAIEQLETV